MLSYKIKDHDIAIMSVLSNLRIRINKDSKEVNRITDYIESSCEFSTKIFESEVSPSLTNEDITVIGEFFFHVLNNIHFHDDLYDSERFGTDLYELVMPFIEFLSSELKDIHGYMLGKNYIYTLEEKFLLTAWSRLY